MYGSRTLNPVFKNYAVITKRLKSNSGKGEVIKKLNKENKSLFGELLETRSQKRKRVAKEKPKDLELNSTTDSYRSAISSEMYWYSQSRPSSYVIRSRKDSKVPEEKHFTSNNSNKVIKQVEETKTIEDSLMDSHENSLSSNCSNELGKVYKKSPLQLPDVIIRNIPSFPLENKEKDINTEGLLNSIVSIPSNIEEENYLSYPSVSKILNSTMPESSRAALKRWRQKMVAELGEEGFQTHYRGLLEKGSKFHGLIQDFLSGMSETELKLDQVEGCWESMREVITDVTQVKVLESHVVHSRLLYRGIIDCVASYRGKPVLIEWKKSDKQKCEIEKTYDAPLQLCAYVGALNYDAKYSLKVNGGLVVVAYSDGSPAHTFRMNLADCQKYWRLWLHRLHKYWSEQQHK